jgi:hypothetical protein
MNTQILFIEQEQTSLPSLSSSSSSSSQQLPILPNLGPVQTTTTKNTIKIPQTTQQTTPTSQLMSSLTTTPIMPLPTATTTTTTTSSTATVPQYGNVFLSSPSLMSTSFSSSLSPTLSFSPTTQTLPSSSTSGASSALVYPHLSISQIVSSTTTHLQTGTTTSPGYPSRVGETQNFTSRQQHPSVGLPIAVVPQHLQLDSISGTCLSLFSHSSCLFTLYYTQLSHQHTDAQITLTFTLTLT